MWHDFKAGYTDQTRVSPVKPQYTGHQNLFIMLLRHCIQILCQLFYRLSNYLLDVNRTAWHNTDSEMANFHLSWVIPKECSN